MPKSPTKTDEPNLEKTMTDIDNIVDKMESGKLSLAESVALFEQGTHLIKNCQKTLKEAEQTVTTLMQEDPNNDSTS